MDIDASLGRDVQQRLGKDLAEGHHHDQVRGKVSDGLHKGGIANLGWLKNRNAMAKRQLLDRRGRHFLAASLGAIRLGNHGKYVFSAIDQGLERGTGKVGCAHEDYAQTGHFTPDAASAALRALRWNRSRFNGER